MPFPDFLQSIGPVGDPYVLGRWHKDRVSHRGYVRELRARLRAALQPRPASRKMLVIGRARSGTTLLVKLLNQTPEIRCDAEVLHFAVTNPRRYLNDLAAIAGAPAYGCKLLSYQLLEVHPRLDPSRFLAELIADGWRLLHIRRATFRQALSLSMAQETGRYFRGRGGDEQSGPVALDPARFEHQLRWNAALLDFETALLRDVPHLSVDYDAELADTGAQQACVDRLCAALGVASGPVAARSGPVLGEDYAARVANFDALRRVAATLGLA